MLQTIGSDGGGASSALASGFERSEPLKSFYKVSAFFSVKR
jgi:hypothetical protein